MRVLATTRVLCCFYCCGFATLAIAHGSEDNRLEPQPDAAAQAVGSKPEDRLSMTPPVACRSIDGFENFEPLPGAALTADEKLLVYYHPLNYRIIKTGASNHIHLIQAGQIRRRGEKTVLLRKENLLDFEIKVDYPPNPIYLKNSVSLKGLKPGEYDYDLILRDKHAPTQVAKETLRFRVVAAALPNEDDDTAKPAEKASSARSKSRARLRRASHANGKRKRTTRP
ncbi:hypothetical protein SAMN05444166_6104 [Singulisphaera sp. GP187]|uniref:hypothetical protein n=1 Tax=Singulisphaera sp. GP187 TaxID=1882752 RepID=UPI00092CB79D|nr:hypothetical protein [Singulisphaera sp. GP187]SIO59583.1 hypothetical protein SAMN05444166_6104 [Singulisphaera sp. GP187]